MTQACLVRCWMVQKDYGSYLDSLNSTEVPVLDISYWFSVGSSLPLALFQSHKSYLSVHKMLSSLDMALRCKWGC